MNPKHKLISETRWSRHYHDPGTKANTLVNRFWEGTATITLAELERDWHRWPSDEQQDFARSFHVDLLPEGEGILRFLIEHGDHRIWPEIALNVASKLPVEESIFVLGHWCKSCDLGQGADYYVAIARTNDPQAHTILKKASQRLLFTKGLLDQNDKYHRLAYDLIQCLIALMELNENPNNYREMYLQLTRHPNDCIRQMTKIFLERFFEPNLLDDE